MQDLTVNGDDEMAPLLILDRMRKALLNNDLRAIDSRK
jgi:hypothetical protein